MGKDPATQQEKTKMIARTRNTMILTAALLGTLLAAPALAASTTSPGGRMAWSGPDYGTVWKVDKNGNGIVAQTFNMGTDWEIRGVSHDKVLWQRSDGEIFFWTLESSLQKQFEAQISAPAAGYEAVSISADIQNWFFCLEDDDNYYILLRPDPESRDPVLVWLVSSEGRRLRQDQIWVENPGFEAVHFGMSADGSYKLVWAASDGRADVWDMEWNSSLSPAGWLQVGRSTYGATAMNGMVVTGYSYFVDDAGHPYDRMLYAQVGTGDALAQSLRADGSVVPTLVNPNSPIYSTGYSETAIAYTDSRPLCNPPEETPLKTLPFPRGYEEKAEIYEKTGGQVYDAVFIREAPIELE
jgi:hypothetical protein